MTAKTKAIVDWISVTCKDGKLAPSDWTNDYQVNPKGMLGYPVRIDYSDGRIELSNPNRKDMGVHIIYSGECLRKMEQTYAMDAENIVIYHQAQGHKFTRLDIAIDIIDGFTARECIERYENKECVSKMRRADKVQSLSGRGDTIYIGRRGGDRLIRIYDKAAQTNTEGSWTRVEGEFRAFGAESVINAMRDAKSPKKAIYAIMRGIVDYPLWSDWNESLGEDKMVLEIGRKETNSTEEWLIKRVAPSIAKFAAEHEGWLEYYAELINQLIAERKS